MYVYVNRREERKGISLPLCLSSLSRVSSAPPMVEGRKSGSSPFIVFISGVAV